jgi:hypothetical protein
MSEQTIDNEVEVDENEPVYYKPRSLNMVATISGILSWVVLVGFLAVIVGQYFVLTELSQGAALTTLLANPQAKNWVYVNIAFPLLTGISLFALLQGVSIGLNVLLEIDFNNRESKS